MANVLGTLFQDIADAIRGKTGDMASMKPAEFPGKISAIETGGGNVQTIEYLPETTFTNSFVQALGAHVHFESVDAETLETWAANQKPVTVIYDNVEYILTPQLLTHTNGDTGIGVGNAANFGGTGNGEPFLIVQWYLEGEPCFLVASMVDTTPTEHTVRIYQEARDIGEDEWIMVKGSVTSSTGEPVTVEHGLGVKPDIVFMAVNIAGIMTNSSDSKFRAVNGGCLSEKLMNGAEGDIAYGTSFFFIPDSAVGMVGSTTIGLENLSADAYSCFCNITDTTMQLGTSNVYLFPNKNYTWYACAKKEI